MQLDRLISACVLLPLGLATIACRAQSTGAVGAAPPMQSQAGFEAAFRTISTSPAYVLITAVDDNTGRGRTFCTTSNFLLGAIHMEHGLGYDKNGVLKAMSMARENKEHVFHFRKQEALDNVPVSYTESELAAARELLAPLSTEELDARFSALGNSGLPIDRYRRDAIACALIERGLSPQRADISGQVYIPRFDNRKSQ